jgi:dephospho-CoA kinase
LEPSSAGHILRVGITGGIGSGKSLVCSLFVQHGIPVLSADDVAKEIMRNDTPLRERLVTLLGPSTYRSDGELDRGYVASRIFSDATLKRRVNKLVHPKVEEELDKRFAELRNAGTQIAAVEAALLYESGYDKRLDVMIVVDAPETERIRRVAERDKTSPEEVRRRIRAQLPAEKKVRNADYVIRNTGSLRDLENSVDFLIRVLQNTIK